MPIGSSPFIAASTLATSSSVTPVAAAISASVSVRKPFESSAPMTWSATTWSRRRQERVEVPGEVILEREVRLGPRDRVELVVLVAEALVAVGRGGRRRRASGSDRPARPCAACTRCSSCRRSCCRRSGRWGAPASRAQGSRRAPGRWPPGARPSSSGGCSSPRSASVSPSRRAPAASAGSARSTWDLGWWAAADRSTTDRRTQYAGCVPDAPSADRVARLRRGVHATDDGDGRPEADEAVARRVLRQPIAVLRHRPVEEGAQPDAVHVVVRHRDGAARPVVGRPCLERLEDGERATRDVAAGLAVRAARSPTGPPPTPRGAPGRGRVPRRRSARPSRRSRSPGGQPRPRSQPGRARSPPRWHRPSDGSAGRGW